MESPAQDPRQNPDESTARSEARSTVARQLDAAAQAIAAAATDRLPGGAADDTDRGVLGMSIARLLTQAVAAGACDSRQDEVTGLVTLVSRLGLDPQQVGAAVYGAMQAGRVAAAGARDEPVADSAFIDRAAFDVLGAWMTRALDVPTAPALTDRLTTLHTRVMLDTVLLKECQRAERFEHWLSLLLIDLDHLSDLNRTRGYGVGDQVLERMGVLIRKYFRQQDWVARYSEDVVAVLLPETGPEDAATLAHLMRTMLEERLTVDDERQRPVTVSLAVASARPLNGFPIDADRLIDEADAALARVKDGDRKGLELVEIHPVIEPAPTSIDED